MRNGSSKALKTLIIKLSLVTASMEGPGNCPLINIPCHDNTFSSNKSTETHTHTKEKKKVVKYLLFNTKRINITVCNIPIQKSVRTFTSSATHKHKH